MGGRASHARSKKVARELFPGRLYLRQLRPQLERVGEELREVRLAPLPRQLSISQNRIVAASSSRRFGATAAKDGLAHVHAESERNRRARRIERLKVRRRLHPLNRYSWRNGIK